MSHPRLLAFYFWSQYSGLSIAIYRGSHCPCFLQNLKSSHQGMENRALAAQIAIFEDEYVSDKVKSIYASRNAYDICNPLTLLLNSLCLTPP